MYKVIRKFKDKDGRVYGTEKNNVYPHKDAKKPSNARIKILSSTNNKYGQIYIEKVVVEKEVEEKVEE